VTADGDAGIVTGRVRARRERDSESFASDIRFTTFWIVEDGRWVRFGFQDAPAED
jgi:hypothetical protein